MSAGRDPSNVYRSRDPKLGGWRCRGIGERTRNPMPTSSRRIGGSDRLSIENYNSTIAEALAYMHEELSEDGIAHGNLKSTNILFNKNMDPRVSEYGLMISGHEHVSSKSCNDLDHARTFKSDIYGFGVILLELVTGKVVQGDEFELVQWVQSVVQEEWTVEVFDKGLTSIAMPMCLLQKGVCRGG